jgi:hypothetical protein
LWWRARRITPTRGKERSLPVHRYPGKSELKRGSEVNSFQPMQEDSKEDREEDREEVREEV